MAVICFSNQKGGVGKTTSAVNIAAALGAFGKSTLLADIDPQGNATSGVGISKKNMGQTVYDLLIGRARAEDILRDTGFPGLSVLPSDIQLAGAELELAASEGRERRLRDAIEPIRHRFDYIIIDCPPSLGLLTVNGLTAADGVIIPMQCEYYALEGLSQLMMTIRSVRKLYNPTLDITGILVTMHNGRLNLSNQVLSELKKYYANKLFRTMVQRNVKLSEAPSYGQPARYYDKSSKGAAAYDEVAKELMRRI